MGKSMAAGAFLKGNLYWIGGQSRRGSGRPPGPAGCPRGSPAEAPDPPRLTGRSARRPGRCSRRSPPPAGDSPLHFHFTIKLFDVGVELLTGAFFPLQPASAGTGVVAIPQDEQARLGDPFDLKSSGGMNPPISALRAAANAAVALRNASLRLGVRQD